MATLAQKMKQNLVEEIERHDKKIAECEAKQAARKQKESERATKALNKILERLRKQVESGETHPVVAMTQGQANILMRSHTFVSKSGLSMRAENASHIDHVVVEFLLKLIVEEGVTIVGRTAWDEQESWMNAVLMPVDSYDE